MKTKQIVLGLILVPLVYFMGSRSAFAVTETATIPFLFVVAILVFLLSLFAYKMKIDIANMQKTINAEIVEG